jgi:hypothetical protein
MATAWPNSLYPTGLEWRLMKAGAQFRSPFTGSLQAVDFLGEYWAIRIQLRGEGWRRKYSPLLESLLMYLAGGMNQVDVFHWVRPVPIGTMRGSPTVQTTTARGDSQLVVATTTGWTLLAGDLIKAGSQVFMVRTDCVASGGVLTVPLVNRIRGVISSGSAVTWDRPTLTVVMPEMSGGLVYQPGMRLPAELELVEP